MHHHHCRTLICTLQLRAAATAERRQQGMCDKERVNHMMTAAWHVRARQTMSLRQRSAASIRFFWNHGPVCTALCITAKQAAYG